MAIQIDAQAQEKVVRLIMWGFGYKAEECVDGPEFYYIKDELMIKWNLQLGFGAFTIDGELSLITSWSMLEDIMDQIG